ncbi:MAG: hypothetical protein L7F78_20985 [Syntrophales bacterium LBB04]|nr:hypothetical protein [Syntrophales bacterium LBB04]
MPKKPFKYFGDLQGYEFLKGVITDDPDSETDTCTVEVFLPSEQSLKTIESVPIFYHCDETVEERENGALEGSSAAFAKDDEVIILKQRDGLDDKIFVIGRIDGAQHCCWIEPWDGPELTTLWPWEHIYGGENQYPGTPIFADNSTAEIEDGILSLNVGQTPTGGHWL